MRRFQSFQYAAAAIATLGLVLPPVDLIMPYKYDDNVTIKIDARSTIEILKQGGEIKGDVTTLEDFAVIANLRETDEG